MIYIWFQELLLYKLVSKACVPQVGLYFKQAQHLNYNFFKSDIIIVIAKNE